MAVVVCVCWKWNQHAREYWWTAVCEVYNIALLLPLDERHLVSQQRYITTAIPHHLASMCILYGFMNKMFIMCCREFCTHLVIFTREAVSKTEKTHSYLEKPSFQQSLHSVRCSTLCLLPWNLSTYALPSFSHCLPWPTIQKHLPRLLTVMYTCQFKGYWDAREAYTANTYT